MKRKINSFKLLAVLLIAVVLSSCSINSVQNTETDLQESVSNENNIATIITSDMVTYDKDDYYNDWENQNPTYIELKVTSASINGSGAVVNDNKINITTAGVYAISGKLGNGQIIVDVQDKGTVRLVLNGVELSSSDNAPIYVKNAGKTIISLQEGTQNTITDGSKYILSDTTSDEPSAAIFSKDDLTINGTGKLTVRANYKDGIASKDDLKITGGNIDIVSVDDGLIGRDMLLVKEGNIIIEAGGDGIKATNDTDAAKGYIALGGGTFYIKAGADGIQAETSVLISGGKFTISTGGGSANAPERVKSMGPRQMEQNTTASSTNENETQSKKAIKAASDITISGGTIDIDSYDDAVHSNNSIHIAGGDITINSGDDGIHADAAIEINAGKIDIKKSYEGIESMVVTVSDGEIYIISSDDGINVNGGNDGSSVNGRPGQNAFAVSENSKLNINGGYISVNSSGDGLDSNGSIYMTNGTVYVSGPTDNGNGALDYNGTFEMSGGFLIAAGSSGMAEAPSEQSTQNSILMYYPNMQQAGTLVHLEDSEGNTVVTFAPKKEYQSVVISSPALEKDAVYTLYSGGALTGSISDGFSTGGDYQVGTKVVDFTITSAITWLDETGLTTQKGSSPGGGKGRGFGNRPVPADSTNP